MRTVRTVADLRAAVADWRTDGAVTGLAPTMGGLHAGHLALVDALRREGASRVIASIFVNPTQFGVGEDFDAYPRGLDADSEKLLAAGVDLLFAPSVEEVYRSNTAGAAVIDLPGLSGDLCGQFRPGHFAGVATVVAKLFNMAKPDLAAFGEKDYQQLVIIRRMAECLDFPIRIVAAATVREADGLALSSRNFYLTEDERSRAPELYGALTAARDAISQGAEIAGAESEARARIEAHGFDVEYVSVRRAHDLAVPEGRERELIILAAARLGQTRLIDNLKFEAQ